MKNNSVLLSAFLILTIVLIQPQLSQAQQTYTISGQVTGGAGRGIDGVVITFNDGGTPATKTTSGGGFFSHTVNSGWTGTVTPSHDCYTFAPASASIGPVNGNTVQNFTGSMLTYTISGTVTDNEINPISGVLLALSTGGSTISGLDGTYSFTVPCGWGGTVTPSIVGWTFDPANRYYVDVASDQTDEGYVGTTPQLVGGHTEPISPLVLLWPWTILILTVSTGIIAATALKERRK